jgi:hypothetical protein
MIVVQQEGRQQVGTAVNSEFEQLATGTRSSSGRLLFVLLTQWNN